MFKIESYLTPILLSYVDKYIKNFRLEDSQLSLWGGDASFHNLDLRLEVLEHELHLPFSFVSGHIRELLIHVPWTKLASEPIVITINTIECILKLKGATSGAASDTSSNSKEKQKKPAKPDIETPPSYLSSLINKIVCNIRIYCNNLILKYVEEDIVLSMNVKHFKLESANDQWEPAYIDLPPDEVTLRKIIAVNDLTVCLDKRNAAGKIDIYQEPMLYKCSMTMHFLRQYHSATANRSSTTRLDIYCNNMEFGMTEQQVPMAMRLLMLIQALQQKEIKKERESPLEYLPTEVRDIAEHVESWTDKAWSYFSSITILSSPRDSKDWAITTMESDNSGHIIQIGFYVDNASLTFKVSEASSDRGYYAHRKLRYLPVLSLNLQGIYSETIICGISWMNSSFGISQILLHPVGYCTCSYIETPEGQPPNHYLKIGSVSNSHKTHCLFDVDAVENKGQKKKYNTSWDYHMSVNTEAVLLERTAAFAFDLVRQMEIPDDIPNDKISEMNNDYEYSNFTERESTRICVGPLKFRLCSGFFHRLGSLKVAASAYDYAPYFIPKPDPDLHDLLPPSEEDFDALTEFIPTRTLNLTVFAPVVEIEAMEHPNFFPVKGKLFRKHKKPTVHNYGTSQPAEEAKPFTPPKIVLECQFIDFKITNPIYPNRLVHTTCQLPDPPKQLFEACYSKREFKILGVTGRLIVSNNPTTLIVPWSASVSFKSILKPQYWLDSNIPHDEITLESESITINGSKPKMLIMYYIINHLLNGKPDDHMNPFTHSTLLADARKDTIFPLMEFCIEGIRFKKVNTNSTVSIDTSLGSIRAFIFETEELKVEPSTFQRLFSKSQMSLPKIQQVLFLSGPEYKTDKRRSPTPPPEDEAPLFSAIVQYSIIPDVQRHAPILVFDVKEIRICMDPLLCKWLLYMPKYSVRADSVGNYLSYYRTRSFEASASGIETPRRMAHLESIHSSSDPSYFPPKQNETLEETIDTQERIYNFLKNWFDVWKGLLISGDISQCTIYFPMVSLSAVGSQGIQEAVEQALAKDNPPELMVITLPFTSSHSAQKQNISGYLTHLPVILPENLWTIDKSSFPWTVTISNLSCYTIQHGMKLEFLKPVSLSATVGWSTRSSSVDSISSKMDICGLGVCVHIDMTPIFVSTSEIQVYLLASILYGLTEAFYNMIPEKKGKSLTTKYSETIPVVNSTVSETVIMENSLETISQHSKPTPTIPSEDTQSDSVKLTAWFQWTANKITFELLSTDYDNIKKQKKYQPKLKLVIDAEDIVSSLDFQNVYLKMKSKIGTISMQHYKYNSLSNVWLHGPYLGVVMRHREDTSEERHDESGFISITITRASCQHTHTLWGALSKAKKEPKADGPTPQVSPTRYITEVVVNIRPIDFVFSFSTLRTFYLVLKPLLDIPHPQKTRDSRDGSAFNNQMLPLAYLECENIRIIVPVSKVSTDEILQDTYVFQVNKISLSPSAVNPICRSPSRPDIYQRAAQMRILNIPGSEVEDRQYQLDVTGISVSSGVWKNVADIINQNRHSADLSVKFSSQNPALEWNNLEKGQIMSNPTMNLWRVIESFDISVVAAPAMVYREDTIICGNSIEVNIVSDIVINLSLYQMKLASAIVDEMNDLLAPITSIADLHHSELIFPYARIELHIEDSDELDLIEMYRDSGIESMISGKVKPGATLSQNPSESDVTFSLQSKTKLYSSVPGEILFTGGKITVFLFETFAWSKSKMFARSTSKVSRGEKAHEDEVKHQATFLPLIFFSMSQPNVYLSTQQLGKSAQLSIFNVALKMSSPDSKPQKTIPREDDYAITLLKTKSGSPHPETGIPPSFLTVKYSKSISKPGHLDVEISRPTSFLFSVKYFKHLTVIWEKLTRFAQLAKAEKIPESTLVSVTKGENYAKFKLIKDKLCGIYSGCIKCDQLQLIMVTKTNDRVIVGVKKGKSVMNVSNRPEKISNFISFTCISMIYERNNTRKIVLNPWNFSLDVCFFWENWQDFDANPQVTVTAESDCIILDICQDRIKRLQEALNEILDFAKVIQTGSEEAPLQRTFCDKEQYYKDDLRAGAFQFVEATTANPEELPLPYQVMFWNKNITAMAWRYPHPRSLMKIRVFPVPFKSTMENGENVQISCQLEYWSDCHNSYLPFTQFFLSENEILHLKLPMPKPQPAVACIWRVVLKTIKESHQGESSPNFSPRALAACMRIDSYFNNTMIPNVSAVFLISKIEVSLHTTIDKNKTWLMPKCLKRYTPDLVFPETQNFALLKLENLKMCVASWEFEMFSVDLHSTLSCYVLDYAFLTLEPLLEPFSSRLELSISDSMSVNFVSKDVQVKFGPSLAHTITVSGQIWSQSFREQSRETQENFIVFTRYVICNDTNVRIRFGQSGTDESILLNPKHCHLYSWRSQKHKPLLKLALNEDEWSLPISLDEEPCQVIPLDDQTTLLLFTKKLSSTQQMITFTGQLVVANMLLEHFELKVFATGERDTKRAMGGIAAADSLSTSMIFNTARTYFMKLRFYGLEGAWTGDIPLMEHTKGAQPWLVKVPLLEKGQFLSIWCRIVVQDFMKTKRILAMLWPLFSVKSNLPVSTKVHIETPMLNFDLDATIKGKGEIHQLYCPGTIDHSHQLTFHLDSSNNSSNPYVPLNYSLVDHHTFFKRMDKENIEDILEALSNYHETKWPYFGEDLDEVDWIVEEQPVTHVQVKYQNSCQYSSSLLVELLPWCLMVNVLGYTISILVEGSEVCSLRHNAIIAPPKLEDNFNIKIHLGKKFSYKSDALAIANVNWSTQSFFMPKINGIIPPDGQIFTDINCDKHLCRLVIKSSIVNDIRLLKMASSHILCNNTSFEISVLCYAVPSDEVQLEIPARLSSTHFKVGPKEEHSNNGVPVLLWYKMGNISSSQSLEFYMTFSIQPELGWSCPVNVTKVFVRKSISVIFNCVSIPIAITCCDNNGEIYVSLHADNRPQMLVDNQTSVLLRCAQARPEDDTIYNESEHFKWTCSIPPQRSCYYSTPTYSAKFPEIPPQAQSERIVFSSRGSEKGMERWSSPVSITHDMEQFLRVPGFGDVKVAVKNSACLSFVTISSVDQVEISAKDIKSRLLAAISSGKIKEDIQAVESHTSLKSLDEAINQETDSSSESDSKLSLAVANSQIRDVLPLLRKCKTLSVQGFVNSLTLTFLSNIQANLAVYYEVANLICDNISFTVCQNKSMKIVCSVEDIQIDNQLHSRQNYDFPVILVAQDKKTKKKLSSLQIPIVPLIKCVQADPLLKIKMNVESWNDTWNVKNVGLNDLSIFLKPLSCYIEDVFIMTIAEYFESLAPMNLVLLPKIKKAPSDGGSLSCVTVLVPPEITWECAAQCKALTIRHFCIHPISVLISIQSSIKMFIALDQSPMEFSEFQRKRLFTNAFKLGHTLTMHFLSGAIFRAGWVVGSLEILGSPGGLARAMGSGLRDFISLPYYGLFNGPMAFLSGVTNGSASLMKHITAGTLHSVTKMAASVARNLDKLTMDEEHVKRTDAQRRQKPQGVAEGLMQGLTGLGISVLGAIGGIAHHPLQSVIADGGSPRSLAAGVGMGIVGVIAKPLSGAADLVALTGQGLLQGAGWSNLPEPRASPITYHIYSSTNSVLKYLWKVNILSNSTLLHVTDATCISPTSDYTAVALLLTNENLIIVNTDNDTLQKTIELTDLEPIKNNDPTMLTLRLLPKRKVEALKDDDDLVVEMDPACRARVADYVKNTMGLLQLSSSEVSRAPSEMSISPLSSPGIQTVGHDESTLLTYYVNPQNRNYFLCLLSLAKYEHYNNPVS